MKKNLASSIFLFFISLMFVYATGETQKRKELEQYPIKVAPLSLRGGIAYEFVFIDTDKMILVDIKKLVEVNFSTNTQKTIALPGECSSNEFMSFRKPFYDAASNSVHIFFSWVFRGKSPARRFTYHILHLDDYSWEAIEELGDFSYLVNFYDSTNKHIYIQQNKSLLKFDLV
jgi:hypothetical protein